MGLPGLDHTTARRELQRHRQEFSVEALNFADTFRDMQQLRHLADYDHNAALTLIRASVALDKLKRRSLTTLKYR